jgi:hypothetical protein
LALELILRRGGINCLADACRHTHSGAIQKHFLPNENDADTIDRERIARHARRQY